MYAFNLPIMDEGIVIVRTEYLFLGVEILPVDTIRFFEIEIALRSKSMSLGDNAKSSPSLIPE